MGGARAIAVCSGSAGYLAALRALDLPHDRAVVLPAFAWPQLLAAPRALGLPVAFVDCDDSGRMDVAGLENLASRQALAAVVVCHLFGNPNDMLGISRIARSAQIPVIEDCSQALGALYLGRRVGLWGAVAFASLGRGKALDVGEGGVVWTLRPGVARRLFCLTQHPDRAPTPAQAAEILASSLSLRMHPAAARTALRQLDGLDARLESISSAVEMLRTALTGCVVARVPQVHALARPVWQHCPVVLQEGGRRLLQGLLWEKKAAYAMPGASVAPSAAELDGAMCYLAFRTGTRNGTTQDILGLVAKVRTRLGQGR